MSIRSIVIYLFVGFMISANLSAQDSWNQTTAVSDYKADLKQYLKNIESKSQDAKLMANIGEAYFFLNQMTEAKEWFAKAVGITALSQKHQLQYAKCLLALNEYSAAKNWFLMYAENNPEVGNHYASSIDVALEMEKIAPIFSEDQVPFNTSGAELSASIVGDRIYYLIKTNFAVKLVYAEGVNSNSPLRYMGEINTGIKLQEVSWFSFTFDRKKVAYVKQKSFADQRQIPEVGFEGELFIADVRSDGTWVNSKAFSHNNQNNILYPSFSQDGNTLYFSSDRMDGFGGLDIYSSTYSNGEWSFPKNVGPDINTPGHEISPCSVGGSLYFSSNWHEGFGGYDIFRADLMDLSKARIFHQGKGINSSRDDFGLQMISSSQKGYMISNRVGTSGMEDLFAIRKGSMNSELIVLDGTLKTPISNATVDMTACDGTSTTTDFQGRFKFNKSSASNCVLTISKDGYQSSQLTLGSSVENNYSVTLNKASSTYQGIVVDEGTGYILDNVNVMAKEKITGTTLTAVSDAKGQYNLGLNAGKTYTLTFSKPGYGTTSKEMLIEPSTSLGISGLNKSVTASTSTPTRVPDTAPTTTTSPGSTVISTPSTTSTQMTYAVQVAAIKPGKYIDLNTYSALNNIGAVFVENGSDYNRVRVGRFLSKAEAEAAKKKVRSQGYSSAYVVEQKSTITTTSAIPNNDSTTDKSPVYTTPSTPAPSSVAEYKIRLTALRNADAFDYSTAQQYGRVETTMSNGFTVFYIAGIKDLENGRIYLQQLKNNGFSDAYLVQKSNGVLTKVQ